MKINGSKFPFRVKGAVISSIDVISGSGTCSSSAEDDCTYKPWFLKQPCYWKHKCFIQFPKNVITKSTYWSKPCPNDNLMLKKVRCFPKKSIHNAYPDGHANSIIDICADNISGNLSIDSGLLRSHQQYPWLYQTTHDTGYRNTKYDCRKALWLSARNSKLLVTVNDIDIAYGDHLNVKMVSTDDKVWKETITTNKTIFYNEQKYVEYAFEMTRGSNGGRGFLLCFIRLKSGEYDPTLNACDMLMSRSVKIKTKRIRKGRKRGRNGRKRSRKKKKVQEEWNSKAPKTTSAITSRKA